ncbi:MAG: hypothetical protein QM802_11555 [Agriterribacter sp.]
MTNKIIISTCCVIFLLGCNKVRVENYFIPQDFTGNIAVVYSNDKISSTEDVYSYIIPQNGILYTDYVFKKGNFKINFYQKRDLNQYDTLFKELPGMQVDTTKNRVYFNRVLTFSKGKGKEIFVSTFYVGKARDSSVKKDRFLFEQNLEKDILGN